jgi:NADH-quinone oxidoreductase subunit H
MLQSPFLAGLAVIYAFAGLAECQRAPFDMAEAESELVSGFNTEYSGFRWGMFAMAEYSEMVLVGCLFSVLFLGGYQSPIGEEWIVAAPVWIEVPLHLGILLAKFTLVVVVMVWIRWTLPRFRVDQVMRLCWLTLVPLGLLCVAGLATTMLLAGTVADGPAYGRFAPQAQLVLSPLGRAVSWAIPVALVVVLVVLARRRYGPQHDDLRRLTGSAP